MNVGMHNNDFDILLRSAYYSAKLQFAKSIKKIIKTTFSTTLTVFAFHTNKKHSLYTISFMYYSPSIENRTPLTLYNLKQFTRYIYVHHPCIRVLSFIVVCDTRKGQREINY